MLRAQSRKEDEPLDAWSFSESIFYVRRGPRSPLALVCPVECRRRDVEDGVCFSKVQTDACADIASGGLEVCVLCEVRGRFGRVPVDAVDKRFAFGREKLSDCLTASLGRGGDDGNVERHFSVLREGQ